jgi:hypothetical protein
VRNVYFDDLLTEDPAYFRVRIGDSKFDRIASLKGVRRWSSLIEPPWSGLAPGGMPLFTRDLSTQGNLRSRLAASLSEQSDLPGLSGV